jgi:hypothetical protein
MDFPDKINIENDEVNEDAVITLWVKDKKEMLTPTEALGVINQLSGVLLAYGISRQRS